MVKQLRVVALIQELQKLTKNSKNPKELNVKCMSDFISDIDTAKLYVQFFRPFAQCPLPLKC